MTDYDKIISEIQAEDRAKRARAAGLTAPAGGGDEVGTALRLGEAYGVPPGAAVVALPDLRERERLDRIEKSAKGSDPLARWLGTPENTALAGDDLDVLDKIGRRFNDGLLSMKQRLPLLPLTDGAEARQAEIDAARAGGPQMTAAPVSWFDELIGKYQSGWFSGKAGVSILVDPINPVRMVDDNVARGLGYRDAAEYNLREFGGQVASSMRQAAAADRETAETTKALQNLAAADASGSTWEVAKAAANPRVVMAVLAQSFGNTTPQMAMSLAMPAGRLVAAVTAGAGSFSTEQGMTVLDVMGEGGVDTENAEQVIGFLGDRKKMAGARDRAS